VTRLTDLTRLDRIGVPVFAAIRGNPMGEAVSVSTGKGWTADAAELGALAEALERYCAEPRSRLPIARARHAELDGESLAPQTFPVDPNLPPSPDATLEWVRGSRIGGGEPVWIPANAVFFPYEPRPLTAFFAANTNGLAAGETVEDAICHGLLECIERDAYARALLLATLGKGDLTPPLRPTDLGPRLTEISAALAADGFALLFRDVTADTGVPTVLCTISDREVVEDRRVHYGCAARLLGTTAGEDAFLEAVQSRSTDLQGAREDLTDPRDEPPPHRWFVDGDDETHARPPTGEAAANSGASITRLLAGLERVGIHDAAFVELSTETFPLRVVRVVVPALEIWADDPHRRGKRFLQWMSESSS
jgi:ribosomal protein S12 methylthiotransferase accessory factor